MFEILFFEDENGNSPVLNLLASLKEQAETNKRSRTLLNQIAYSFERLKRDGTRAGKELTKHIEGDIWELRPGNHRIFFFGWKGPQFVLLHGFQKKSQKTPPEEIELAKKEMRNWLNRHEEE